MTEAACRDCESGPALNPSCEDFIEHLGGCLLCRDCCSEQRRLMLARMVELASTATPDSPENLGMIHDILMGMSGCDRAWQGQPADSMRGTRCVIKVRT